MAHCTNQICTSMKCTKLYPREGGGVLINDIKGLLKRFSYENFENQPPPQASHRVAVSE